MEAEPLQQPSTPSIADSEREIDAKIQMDDLEMHWKKVFRLVGRTGISLLHLLSFSRLPSSKSTNEDPREILIEIEGACEKWRKVSHCPLDI